MKNRLCDLLKIKYPILQGAMQWLSLPELASAVSRAGGLGIITASSYEDGPDLLKAIQKVRELTDRPFAVNISLFPKPSEREKTGEYLEAVIEGGVPVVETSGRNPEEIVPVLKKAGIVALHKAPALSYALKAQKLGVDAVTVVGRECGGHPGESEVGSLVKIARAAGELSIPLIAGGGVADGRGLAVALCLGADGVVMGTRFLASTECLIHPNFKRVVVDSDEGSTVLIQQSIRNTLRAYANQAAGKVLEMEKAGAGLEQLMTVISGQIARHCYQEGDTEGCVFSMGQSAGLVREVKPVEEIIEECVREAAEVLQAKTALFAGRP